jgi:hypothetical protein
MQESAIVRFVVDAEVIKKKKTGRKWCGNYSFALCAGFNNVDVYK